MKMCMSFIDNYILIDSSIVSSIEIENKKYFFRLVNNLYNISGGDISSDVSFVDDNNNEISKLSLGLYIDFFDLRFDSKKVISELQKSIILSIDDAEKNNLISAYKRLYNVFYKILKDVELPVYINEELDLENIIKLFKVNLNVKDDLLENLLLLIDVEKNLKIHDVLFFINLKQFLSKDELNELYKYSIYNNIKIILIDSQTYGVTLKNERKLVIDEDLEEFVL